MISETWAPEVHDIVNTITAEFLASGPDLLLPTYAETKTEMCKLARRDRRKALELMQRERQAKLQKCASPGKTDSAQHGRDENDQHPASDSPLADAAPLSVASGALASTPVLTSGAVSALATASGASLRHGFTEAERSVPWSRSGSVQLPVRRLAAVKLANDLCSGLDKVQDLPAGSGGPLALGKLLGQGSYGQVFRCVGMDLAAKVFRYENHSCKAREYALAEVLTKTYPGHPATAPRLRPPLSCSARTERAGQRPFQVRRGCTYVRRRL